MVWRQRIHRSFPNADRAFQIPPAVNAVLGGNIGNRFAIRWRMELLSHRALAKTLDSLSATFPHARKATVERRRLKPALYIIWGESHRSWLLPSCLSSCAIHQFAPPSRTWTARNGQLSYRGPKTSLIGEVFDSLLQSRRFRIDFQQRPGRALC